MGRELSSLTHFDDWRVPNLAVLLAHPMYGAVQRGCGSVAVLLEAHVERLHGVRTQRQVIDGEPAVHAVTTPAAPVPDEAACGRVDAAGVWVVTDLQRVDRIHRAEPTVPPLPGLGRADADRDRAGRAPDREGGVGAGVEPGPTPADRVSRIAPHVDVVYAGWGLARGGLPEASGDRIHGPGRARRIIGAPMDGAVQRGGGSLAVLLEGQIDRGQRGVGVAHAVDDKGSRQLDTAVLAEPAQLSLVGIVTEHESRGAGVEARFEPCPAARDREDAGPRFVSPDVDGEGVDARADQDNGIRQAVLVGFALADEVFGVASEADGDGRCVGCGGVAAREHDRTDGDEQEPAHAGASAWRRRSWESYTVGERSCAPQFNQLAGSGKTRAPEGFASFRTREVAEPAL